MLSQPFLEALQTAFWPLFVLATVAGTIRFAWFRQWCIGRATFALVLGNLAMGVWESLLPPGSYLLWWQFLLIDVPVFAIITMPPRHYWQATLGALVLAQIVLHCLWAVAPDFGRWHWFFCIVIGFVKCGVLLLWSGGSRVEHLLDRGAELLARLVPSALARKLAS